MSDSQLDLSKLALDRSTGDSTAATRRLRRWLLRYVLPLSILLGFLGMLGTSAGRQLWPRRSVTVVPVIVKRSEVQQAGTTLFQAAGWIEPRPTAISVAALAPGVIEELLVVEGQSVATGEPIARLISIDAELAVEQSEATLAIRDGELQRAIAEQNAAMVRLENPVHLTVQLAEANSLLARAKTESDKLPFLIEAAEARLKFTAATVENRRAAGAAIPVRTLQQAEAENSEADATLRELRARQPNLKREIEAFQNKADAVQTQLELLFEERRQLEEAQARVASAVALRDEASSLLKKSRLNLERNVIRSPIDGRVLRLAAAPGMRVMGQDVNGGQNSSTVVELYDPTRLQVRADVRLEDVPMVTPGQLVEIETASSGKTIQGRVLQSTSSANIQKNTLEVKIELTEPPPTVSPEMLVTATFLAPRTAATSSESNETERIFVPEQLVQLGDGGSFVWVVDAGNQAVRKPVRVGGTSPDGLVEIVEGLNVTEKLITSGANELHPGDFVVVSGEDQTIGIRR
jgi:HlyD family secretion protein